jgi:hypothetical protein
MLSSDELADPERSFNRLLFAAQDMAECRGAIDFLHTRLDVSGEVWRALETGAMVAYARPWTKGSIGKLGEHWLPAREQRGLHEILIRDRSKLYAHTDKDVKARWVKGAEWSKLREPAAILPALRPLLLDRLPEISQLAEAQKERFIEGMFELVRRAQTAEAQR